MRRVLVPALALGLGLLAGCGGGGAAKVKGRVVENGQPVQVQGQAALVLYPDAGGKPGTKAYPMALNPDGSFELVVSGGEVEPGPYLISLEVNGPKTTPGVGKYKESFKNYKQELKPGMNDLTIELTKPNG
ncbi:MAG: hypothetical protein K2P78_08375 [Gemmataceae bacterium]|nr:hypothetical protein [Gemmataceae bacterium]